MTCCDAVSFMTYWHRTDRRITWQRQCRMRILIFKIRRMRMQTILSVGT